MKRALAAITVGLLSLAGVVIAPSAAFAAGAAEDDSYMLYEDAEIEANVNDNDAQFGVLEIVTAAEHGIVHFDDDGSFRYFPDPDYVGTDSFTYRFAFGPYGEATATFTMMPVYDPPVLADDSVVIPANSGYQSSVSVLDNDVHIDDVTIAADAITELPAHGPAYLDSNGTFFYFPVDGYVGLDQFTYRVTDRQGTQHTAVVYITVNDAPVAVPDDFTMLEDGTLTITAAELIGNDTDQVGGPLTLDELTAPTSGDLATNGAGTVLTYTPPANFSGPVQFDYRVTDGYLSGWGTVTITVTSVTDAAVPVNDSYSVVESGVLVVNAADGVLSNDTNVDAVPISAAFSTAPNANGTLNGNADGSFTFTPTADFYGTTTFTYWLDGSPATTATITFTVTSSNIAPTISFGLLFPTEDTTFDGSVMGSVVDADGDTVTVELVSGPQHGTMALDADGDFQYTPTANYSGSDSFTFRAFDGESYSAVGSFYLFVNPVNDAPVTVADNVSTAMGVPLVISPLANDYDIDGTLQPGVYGTEAPSHGTLSFSGTTVTYTPDAYFHGSDSFTYQAYDNSGSFSTATVYVTVTGDNIAPTANTITMVFTEDGSVSTNLLIFATDLDHFPNPTLTASLATDPSHGYVSLDPNGDYTYTPVANWYGTDTFDYRVSDGELTATATITVIVQPFNDAPAAVADAYQVTEDTALTVGAPGVLANDTDFEGDPLTASLVGAPANGVLALNSDGSFTYNPDADFFGTDSFSYQAVDSNGLAGTTVVVQLTVAAQNDAPAAANDAYSGIEDETLQVNAPGVLANDVDPDVDTLTATIVTPPAHGTLTILATGGFSFTPDAEWSGTDSFTYRANDAQDFSPATVTLTIAAVDDAPTAPPRSRVMVAGATSTTFDLLEGVTDVDGGTAVVVDATDGAHGTVTCVDNLCTYVPAAGFVGADSFSYRLSSGGDISTGTVSITVTAATVVPVALASTGTDAAALALAAIVLIALGLWFAQRRRRPASRV